MDCAEALRVAITTLSVPGFPLLASFEAKIFTLKSFRFL
jgi:hypothetical protein